MRYPSIINAQIKLIGIVLFSFVFTNSVWGQDITALKKDQAQLAEKIAFTNKLIAANSDKKSDAELKLALLDKQIKTRKLLVVSLEKELAHLKTKRQASETEVAKLRLQKENLTKNYSNIIKASYRSKLMKNRWLFLLSAHSMQQLYQRWRYLKQLNGGIKHQLEQLAGMVKLIDLELESLKMLEQEKTLLVKEQDHEKENISRNVHDQQNVLATLSREEKKLRTTLKQHEKAQAKLKKTIMESIAAVAKKRNDMPLTPAMAELSTTFAANKTKLPWPVTKGLITRTFGKQTHPSLRNVTINNNGIDIHTDPGAAVKSIFKGRVVAQQFIPGYDHMIIISHGTFYTVYSYLSDSKIAIGEEVETGALIGHARTGDGVGQVHLEIWHGKELLDPESWLINH